MIVISIQNAPPKLRGYLTKYMFQISAGVYVSNANAKIRDCIWRRIEEMSDISTKAILVYTKNTEQGFEFKTLHNSWKSIDYDGLQLILIPFEKDIQLHPISNSYVVLDLETTGLNYKKDHILEIGALLVENEIVVEEYNRIIRTEVPKEITKLTGITQEMSSNGCNLYDALIDLSKFINKRDVIGYNIQQFDYPFLLEAYKQCGLEIPVRKIRDVLRIIRKKETDAKSYRLEEIIKKIGIEHNEVYHRAIADCKLCKKVFDYCRNLYRP